MKQQLVLILLGLSTSNMAWSGGNPPSVPNQVLVRYTDSADINGDFDMYPSSELARPLGAINSVRLLDHEQAVLRFSSRLTPLEAARLLRKDSRVVWAQPNYILSLFPLRNEEIEPTLNFFARITPLALLADPGFGNAPELPTPPIADPGLATAWGLGKIAADAAWQGQRGSREIIVADIDTGMDYNHEDLINNVWHNPDPAAADVVGYDFANHDAFPFDDQGHGTHTAGTIGATGGNGKGISGVAQAVSLMAIKFITAEGQGTTAGAVESIDYAIKMKARIMSNSWGGPADDEEENTALIDAVKRAEAADILFVAAAGNDGANNDLKPMYPAAIDSANVLAVASTNSKDALSFFSNFGPISVDVAAPGSNVYSTVPGNKYKMNSGTSMACPHVAGLAALILSERPDLSAAQVKEIILSTVDPIPSLQDKILTGGRINARAALFKTRSL